MDKVKVLVVEDDVPVAKLMAEVLVRVGCEVRMVTSGRQGLELATEERFDIITLDVGLPDLDGFAICQELKQRHISYQTPVIFVAARSALESRPRALELGARDFIEKPFQVDDFISRIGAAAGKTFKMPSANGSQTKV